MKIEQVIVLHLYRNRQVTLQGLGTLYLDNSDSLPVNADMKGPALPVSVRFAYNPNAGEDPSLVDAIVEQTRKLKGLASADLESFINWQKQLLNINMPFTIGDLGELNKASEGSLIFTPFRKQLSLHKATGESGIKSEHGTMQAGNTSRSKYLWLIAVLVGLSIFLWAVYTTVITPKPPVKWREQKTLGATSAKETAKAAAISLDPIHPANVNANDTSIFKVVFLKTHDKEQAIRTLNDIYGFGHSALMYSSDSVFTIAIPFNRPLIDTSVVKDSLSRYNSLGRVSIEIE